MFFKCVTISMIDPICSNTNRYGLSWSNTPSINIPQPIPNASLILGLVVLRAEKYAAMRATPANI